MLGNYLIGVREGIEAALIVSILITYLVRTNRTALMRYVWVGVGCAVAFSIVIAVSLEAVSSELSAKIEPIFAGTVSFLAVGFVTWMIFWMKRTARSLAGDLRAKLDSAAVSGGALAVALMAFAAVAREGTEIAVFFWAAAHATGAQVAAVVGLLLGLITAIFVGWVIFKSTVRINLSKLFLVTGILLVFVAAGVLSYGVHEFQEVGLLPGESWIVLDLSNWLVEGSVQSSLAAGLINLKATTSGLQAIAYLTYSLIVLVLILRPGKVVKVAQASPLSERIDV